MTVLADNILVPGTFVKISNVRAAGTFQVAPLRTIIIGQRLSTGTTAKEILTQIFSVEDAQARAGLGSMVAEMAAHWFLNNNIDEIYFIGLDDDGGATQGTQLITVAGPATAAGTMFLHINGDLISVGVANGDTADEIAAAINTELARFPQLAITAGAVTNVVTLTARNGGTVGNTIDVRFNINEDQSFPQGVTAPVTTGVTGATDPDLDLAIAVIPDTKVFGAFIVPYNDVSNTTKIVDEAERRFEPIVQTEGHVFQSKRADVSDIIAFADDRNSPNQSVIDGGEFAALPSYLDIAGVVGQAANALNIDPARPLKTLVVNGSIGDEDSFLRNFAEEQSLLVNGASIRRVAANGDVSIGRMVTTYRLNDVGSPDTSFQSINTVFIASFLRQSIIGRVGQKFGRHKLAQNGTRFGAGQPVVTPNIFIAEMVALFGDWEEAGLVEDATQFKAEITAIINLSNPNKLDVVMGPNFINQFHIADITLEFLQ